MSPPLRSEKNNALNNNNNDKIINKAQIRVRKKNNDLSPNDSVFTRGVTKVRVSDADRKCLAGVLWLKEIGQIMRGCSRDGFEADR